MKKTPLRLVTGAAKWDNKKRIGKLIIPSRSDTFKPAHALASEVLMALERRTKAAA